MSHRSPETAAAGHPLQRPSAGSARKSAGQAPPALLTRGVVTRLKGATRRDLARVTDSGRLRGGTRYSLPSRRSCSADLGWRRCSGATVLRNAASCPHWPPAWSGDTSSPGVSLWARSFQVSFLQGVGTIRLNRQADHPPDRRDQRSSSRRSRSWPPHGSGCSMIVCSVSTTCPQRGSERTPAADVHRNDPTSVRPSSTPTGTTPHARRLHLAHRLMHVVARRAGDGAAA
jgi:hypothetical protein